MARNSPTPTALDKPKRRAPGEGRQLILDAAHQVFSERGYSGATTREIADRAGVVEALLFRNFGSKAALFNEVVFGPIQAFVHDWEEYERSIGSDYADEEHGQLFVDRFYDLLRENRGLVISYLATTIFDPEVLEGDEATAGFNDIIRTFDRLGSRRVAGGDGGKPHSKKEATRDLVGVRSLVGMVMMAAMFEDLLFDLPGQRPDPRVIKDELSRIASNIVSTYLH